MLGFLRHLFPARVVEGEVSFPDALVHAGRDASTRVGLWVEGRCAGEHDVESDTERPQIDTRVVAAAAAAAAADSLSSSSRECVRADSIEMRVIG